MKISVVLLLMILIGMLKVGRSITNGIGASPGNFPYQVAIFCEGIFECGGGIIDATHVLTAAHCVDFHDAPVIMIQAGSKDLNDPNTVEKSVQSVHVHPLFRRWYFDINIMQIVEHIYPQYDIAVLTINKQFMWDHRIAPVSLPVTNFEEHHGICSLCYFSGWGKTEVLNEVPSENLQYMVMKIIPSLDCSTDGVELDQDKFCAQDIMKDSITLAGDSGGALVCDHELVGILSGGTSVPPSPSIFTNVQITLDFINKVLNNQGLDPETMQLIDEIIDEMLN